MRLIKMFGLAAVAAIASMAFIGASSAMANGSTTLCKVNELPCSAANQVTHVHFESVGSTELTGLGVTILCLKSLALGDVEGLSLRNPLLVLITELTWAECGTNAAHTNCTVTTLHGVLTLPLFDILKTAVNLGTATALSGSVLVNCPNILLHCVFGGNNINVGAFTVESALHTLGAGHGMLTANALAVPKKEDLFACPAGNATWTALYEPLTHLWISS